MQDWRAVRATGVHCKRRIRHRDATVASFDSDVRAYDRQTTVARRRAIDLAVHIGVSKQGRRRHEAVAQVGIEHDIETWQVRVGIQKADPSIWGQTGGRATRGDKGNMIGFIIDDPRRSCVVIVNTKPGVKKRCIGNAALGDDGAGRGEITYRCAGSDNRGANGRRVKQRPTLHEPQVAVDDVVLDAIGGNGQAARDGARPGQRRGDGHRIRRVGISCTANRARRPTPERECGRSRMGTTQQHATEEGRQQTGRRQPGGRADETSET